MVAEGPDVPPRRVQRCAALCLMLWLCGGAVQPGVRERPDRLPAERAQHVNRDVQLCDRALVRRPAAPSLHCRTLVTRCSDDAHACRPDDALACPRQEALYASQTPLLMHHVGRSHASPQALKRSACFRCARSMQWTPILIHMRGAQPAVRRGHAERRYRVGLPGPVRLLGGRARPARLLAPHVRRNQQP